MIDNGINKKVNFIKTKCKADARQEEVKQAILIVETFIK